MRKNEETDTTTPRKGQPRFPGLFPWERGWVHVEF